MRGFLPVAFYAIIACCVVACSLPPKPDEPDFCDNQPASVDTILAAQNRGVMTKQEVETFFDLLLLAQVHCDASDQAAISEVKVELEILARKVSDRKRGVSHE